MWDKFPSYFFVLEVKKGLQNKHCHQRTCGGDGHHENEINIINTIATLTQIPSKPHLHILQLSICMILANK